ncbi:tetratricopeptide repeat protein [Phormidium sp. LEGE 05292]|uniref:tetratricopeptide repeat protein n=1 Tax=[Phormidium] sp. LEGE 05292 TaxID=767427 RepID=UPI001880579F|nr:tetratricopeptide repeat protein [Phormidium sp. LEGE 05292]MBE9229047.1 tetratricopeptide repeat protein [Phormidium sp. LEGE 05292]
MIKTVDTPSLNWAIEEYENAIKALETADHGLSAQHILKVLTARDAVQAAINQKKQPNSDALIKRIKQLDTRLENKADSINRAMKIAARLEEKADSINRAIKLADWQTILNSPKKDWWWLLDPITANWLWRFLSLVFVTISLSLIIDISAKFFQGGPDTTGVFAVIVPSVLTLLAGGGALTKPGQEGMEYILTSLKFDRNSWDKLICLFSAIVLAIVVFIWFSLPSVANSYVHWGDQAYCQAEINQDERTGNNNCLPKIDKAESRYQRAIILNSGNAKAHYKLGKIYQETEDFEQAISHYKIAAKGGIDKAYYDLANLYFDRHDYPQSDRWLRKVVKPLESNKQGYEITKQHLNLLQKLARTYLEQKEYPQAIYWLTLGRDATKDNEIRYNVLKLLGWVYVKQQRYDAISILQDAIKIDREKASAYCLLAQAWEQQGNSKEAKTNWEQCLAYSNQSDPDEDKWNVLANQYLKHRGEQG